MLTLCLTACGQDTTQIAKDEFLKYHNGKDEVAVVIEHTIYMEKNQLDLSGLIKDNDPNGGLIIKQDKLYFSTSVQNSMFNYSLNIYESDFQGVEIKLLFSKEGFRTLPWAYATNDTFYIEHYSNNAFNENSRLIDKYTISTGIYENINSGKDCDLSDYQKKEHSRYSVEVIENDSPKEHGGFIITDSETGAKKTIDDDFLKNTIYIESMEKFNYGAKRFDISNGHMLLTYGIAAGDGWNYSHLVFEYDFDSNTLEYKLLAFPYDSVPVEIIYIG